ncbi:hypothetical protein V1520DRAFT_393654 [Lipomyces starkeyi]|uniref:Uncharacterized protein n=1 Tax=Lipomyces starkeyi NRRL Y-11557 TaxID=675824 RepID=A0A1E3PUM8_LIPST|nr:hypothetical protein LIPSTDRAFT_30927 [Lipomyces starkeyi NRRL Y-11557]
MSLVYGEPDPQSARARRASGSVAPIATPSSERVSGMAENRNATRVTAKRKAMGNEPAIHVVIEINTAHHSSESAGSTTEISSMMSSTVSKEMRSVRDECIISDYNKAFKLLQENPPEQRLDIHLPHSKYLQLNDAFSELKLKTGISDDQRYPYLSYNSLTEIVTVVTVPNSIHEVAVYELNSRIIASANAYLSEHAPELRRCIVPLGSTTTTDFEGDYTNSSKQPDGGIKYKAIGAGSEVTIAIEVGISQSYKSLCDAKDMWINGHHVNICIWVCINELPRFKNPTTAHDNIEDVQAEMATMAQSTAEPMRWYVSQGYYGPICYRRHKWAGELNETFVEVWRAGSNPVRIVSQVL